MGSSLQNSGIEVIDQHPVLSKSGKIYFVDIYIPDRRLAIEVDGGYHLLIKKQDAIREKEITETGICVMRITDKDVLNEQIISSLIDKINQTFTI